MKHSYKLRSLGRAHVDAVIRSSPTLAEAARRLDVDPSTIRRWRQAGEIEALNEEARVPRWHKTPEEIDAMYRAQGVGTKRDPRWRLI